MRIGIQAAALRHTHWYGHVLRFVLGGAVTVAAGLVAKAFGPAVGGFLLAFPAILPAALILLYRSQNEQAHPPGRGARGRRAALLASVGAATGSLGLIGFALVVWAALGHAPTAFVLVAATAAWGVVAVSAWLGRKQLWRFMRGAPPAVSRRAWRGDARPTTARDPAGPTAPRRPAP
jgi:uncharacterized membrane protein YfcA